MIPSVPPAPAGAPASLPDAGCAAEAFFIVEAARWRAKRRQARRRLAWIMAISLGAHLLLLLDGVRPILAGLSGGAPQSARRPTASALAAARGTPLQARLRSAAPDALDGPHAGSGQAAPKSLALASENSPASGTGDARSHLPRLPLHSANTRPSAALAPAGASGKIAVSPRRSIDVNAEPVAAPSAASALQTAGATGPAAEVVRAYRFALALALRQLRGDLPWPAAASPAVTAGAADIVLAWEAGDTWPKVRLAEGSGDAVRDAWALNLVQRAAAQTPLPAALRQHAHAFDLPIEFAPRAEP